jgi:hypothetical protein
MDCNQSNTVIQRRIHPIANFTLTAGQLIELLERGELHAEGVRRLVEAQATATPGAQASWIFLTTRQIFQILHRAS